MPTWEKLVITGSYEKPPEAGALFGRSVTAACPNLVQHTPKVARRRVLLLAFCALLRYQALMSEKSIEELARKLAESIPENLRAMRQDLETNFRSVLATGLDKLDLVTREEFEVQEAILARTRAKLEALEKRLAELEKE